MLEAFVLFSLFEKLVDPYPENPVGSPPKGFFAFIWTCTQGARGTVLAMACFTSLTGMLEALLFSMMGRVVDWLSKAPPSQIWTEHRSSLSILGLILIVSPLLVALQTLCKHQALAGNLPMRLRWNFHRLMLNQSMGFYQDEFAGRITAKVMQTALAVMRPANSS
jgi:ATP-binding cassette, subfamily B, multidrug efflux pump